MSEEKVQYALMPCSGRRRLGIPRGHVYNVIDGEGKELGFITEEVALKKYGKRNFTAV